MSFFFGMNQSRQQNTQRTTTTQNSSIAQMAPKSNTWNLTSAQEVILKAVYSSIIGGVGSYILFGDNMRDSLILGSVIAL